MDVLGILNVVLTLLILWLLLLMRAAQESPPKPEVAPDVPTEPEARSKPRVSVIDDQRAWVNERKEAEQLRNELVP